MSAQKVEQIKIAGFVLKPNTPEIKALYLRIKEQFEAKGITVLLSEKSSAMIGIDGIAFEDLCEQSDSLVSLGGAGTLLSLVR
ncbi:MAG TPA: NAD(+) kinase, partial [Epsilonproteobacteria bacterium]|nr:NAD(+) kinase [Campylobacterota bacterium]